MKLDLVDLSVLSAIRRGTRLADLRTLFTQPDLEERIRRLIAFEVEVTHTTQGIRSLAKGD